MKKVLFALVALAMIFGMTLPVQAQGTNHVYVINIVSIQGGPGSTSAEYTNPITIFGNASGTNFVGQFNQYHINIQWGDGNETILNLADIWPTPAGGDFSGDWSAFHSYGLTGTYTIVAMLYHSQPGGNERSEDAITPPVAIHVRNEAPTDISLSNNSVAENQPSGTTVGTLSTTDPDTGDTFTYTLVSGTGSDDNASFSIAGNVLKTAASFDYETKSSYSIRVRSTDAGSLYVEKQFTINVTSANEAPTDISLSNNSVAENQPSGTTVGTLSTTDPDTGDTFTYTLVSGTGSDDNASFSIADNVLKTAASFDYEIKSSYSIRVRSTDAGSLYVEKQFTINVANANEAPTDISLSNNSVAENQPSGTTVGTLSTTDPDVGDTFTYTLVSGTGSDDNASFSIDGDVLKTAAIFDYETKSSYSIRVRSTDAESLYFEKQFNITVTDIEYSHAIIYGQVYDADTGNGLSGVDISLTGAESRSTTTSSTGFYFFWDLSSGSYEIIETNPPGYISTTSDVISLVSEADHVYRIDFGDRFVPPGQRPAIGGIVYDADTLQGISGVDISLTGAGSGSITTDGNGFYIFSELATGTYTVKETNPAGYISTTPDEVPVEVTDDKIGRASCRERV